MPRRSRKTYRNLFLDRAVTDNLVLVEGVGLCPLIGGATTLKAGVTLFLCATVTLIATNLFMLAFCKRLTGALRITVHTLFASLLLCGEAYLINATVSTELYAALYLFLPLLSVTTLFAYHGDNAVGAFDPMAGFLDAFASALGFGVVLCLTGAVREIAARRTLWDLPLPLPVDLPEAAQPFAAFLLIGLLAALLQRVKALTENRRRLNADEAETGGAEHE